MLEKSGEYSHPDSPVRHSYPLAFKEATLSTALRLTFKTLPFVLVRLGIMVGFVILAVAWFALCAGIAYLFSGKDGSGGSGILLMIGFLFPVGFFYWFRQYVLYLLKCAHIAVITTLVTTGDLPKGMSQIQFGKEIVKRNFAQSNILVVVDSLVTGTIRAFNMTLEWVSNIIPIPGMSGAMQIVNAVVRRATTYIDEAVFSYTLARGDKNVFRSSLDGLVYYAANPRPILKVAVVTVVMEVFLTLVLFFLCLLPALALTAVLPHAFAGYSWVLSVAFALAIKASFMDTVFLVMVVTTFHRHIQNQPINESHVATLEGISKKFVELKQKAQGFVPVPS